MGGLMTVIYSFVDLRGINHDIRERDIQDAYRQLLFAGFSMHEAHDKSLDYILAKLTISAIPKEDLLYGQHNYQAEDRLCALVATKLMAKQTQKETTT
jgi:hypothetical protein